MRLAENVLVSIGAQLLLSMFFVASWAVYVCNHTESSCYFATVTLLCYSLYMFSCRRYLFMLTKFGHRLYKHLADHLDFLDHDRDL